MNQKISTDIIFIAIVVVSIALGTYLFSRHASNTAILGSPVNFVASEQLKFSDGLSVTLKEVNDSRCKPGLECIWEGELAPVFIVNNSTTGPKEINLGTVRTKSVTENGYTFTLQDATPITATIVVTKEESTPTPSPTPIACSKEAMLCSDGSFVSRTGPNCEFAKCPGDSTPAPKTETIIKKVGEQEGSFLIQKINIGSVESSVSVSGLWYQAYPVATNKGTDKTLHVGDDIGYACEGVSEKITSIDLPGQTITFTKTVGPRPLGGCPI